MESALRQQYFHSPPSLSNHVKAHPPEIDKHTQNLFRLCIQFLPEIQLTSEVAPKLEKSDLICVLVATCQRISDLHLFEPVPVFGYSVIFAPIAVITFLIP